MSLGRKGHPAHGTSSWLRLPHRPALSSTWASRGGVHIKPSASGHDSWWPPQPRASGPRPLLLHTHETGPVSVFQEEGPALILSGGHEGQGPTSTPDSALLGTATAGTPQLCRGQLVWAVGVSATSQSPASRNGRAMLIGGNMREAGGRVEGTARHPYTWYTRAQGAGNHHGCIL